MQSASLGCPASPKPCIISWATLRGLFRCPFAIRATGESLFECPLPSLGTTIKSTGTQGQFCENSSLILVLQNKKSPTWLGATEVFGKNTMLICVCRSRTLNAAFRASTPSRTNLRALSRAALSLGYSSMNPCVGQIATLMIAGTGMLFCIHWAIKAGGGRKEGRKANRGMSSTVFIMKMILSEKNW